MVRMAVTREHDELWRKYIENNRDLGLRNHLAERYYYFVEMLAGRFVKMLPPSVREEDLCSYGTEGLLTAIERFDPSQKVKFQTYAAQRIRGAMIDGLREEDYLPRSLRKILNRQRQREEEDRSGQAYAKDTFIPLLVSLEEILPKDKDDYGGLWESLSGGQLSVDPTVIAENRDMINHLLHTLSVGERQILQETICDGILLSELGRRRSLTESRICQIRQSILHRVRTRAAAYVRVNS